MSAPPAILIVEDEEGVRSFLASTLRKAGWPTLAAPGGVEGLALALAYDGPIPLAVIDLVMPDMGGLDLANQLGVDRPTTRILYISGYTDSIAMASIRRRAPETVLQKPFNKRQFLERIRDILKP